ncbi:glutathione S-transferase family protein [Parashewanella curva]|uniref:Glutathione S-transferase family protein n=1 Tax=Parashewanella curva TaxID=2338552 RepID=A0A3L8Q185_9GAMM|nr:glutathione S-transferase N-terminal domain-containing protein [Parashewanella curva]RLV60152.1 glutathione S-transferase family protein [Parashewanella curva]
MFIIRWILGRLILLFNFIFAPAKPNHSSETQSKLDELTKNLKLYQYHACPFCVKVRRAIRRLGLNVELVDAKQEQHQQDLVNLGGRSMVPCLRIEEDGKVTWMYESSDIITYLEDLSSK